MQHDAPNREIIIGIDTHKDTHAAVALNALGVRLGATIVPVNRVGYRCYRRLGPLLRHRDSLRYRRNRVVRGWSCPRPARGRASCPGGQSPRPKHPSSERQDRHARCRGRRPRGPLRPGFGGTEDWHQHGRDNSAYQDRARRGGESKDPSDADAQVHHRPCARRAARAVRGHPRPDHPCPPPGLDASESAHLAVVISEDSAAGNPASQPIAQLESGGKWSGAGAFRQVVRRAQSQPNAIAQLLLGHRHHVVEIPFAGSRMSSRRSPAWPCLPRTCRPDRPTTSPRPATIGRPLGAARPGRR